MEKIIEVKKLSKSFGEFQAVGGISFNVKKGEVFSLLGPNGAGKTTTIKMLTTLIEPSSGSVHIGGLSLTENKIAIRRQFGIVFQDSSLDDDLTAEENMFFHAVLYGISRKTRQEKISALLKFFGLWERRSDLVKHFSGGMKKRLEIARALSHDPPLLFLDEPTSGLDPQNRSRLWEYLKELNKTMNMTIFLTTHSMEEVEKVSGRIVIIDHGKISAEGTPEEIKTRTETKTLEEAFLTLTGRDIREDVPTESDQLKKGRILWSGGRKR